MPRKIATDLTQEQIEIPSIYQGHLINKSEGEMSREVYLYHRGSDRMADCTSLMHSFANYFARFVKQVKGRPGEKEKAEARNKELISEFETQHGKELTDIILQGRLRMHLLFNAESGSEYIYNEILELMDYVRYRKGLVDAYGKENIQGYPALAFLKADVRYAMAKSNFKWFLEWYDELANGSDYILPDAAWKNRRQREGRKERQIAETRSLLLEKTKQDKRKIMTSALYESDSARKQPPEFVFSGFELMDMGIVNQLFSGLDDLKRQFARNLIE